MFVFFITFSFLDQSSINMPFYVIFCLLFGFVQVHMSMNIMLTHLTRQVYNPWSGIYFMSVVPLTGGIILSLFTE